jgi:hypothetical protein
MADPELTRAERPLAGAPLETVGRAARFRGAEGELWALPAEDAPIARRLLALGGSRLGGFVSGGEDARGVWLVRRTAPRVLEALVASKGERLAWTQALAIVRDLARALAACEKAALFPGAIRPQEVALSDVEGAWLIADPLVRALVGAPPDTRPSTAPSPKWTPPEQADGAAWDAAANRYVLGLVAYRLLAGALPFGGAGLRHAMREQAAPPAPFEDAVAQKLRPGVQSFVLKMLDPDLDARPASAVEIARRCDELLGAVDEADTPPPAPPHERGPVSQARARELRAPAARPPGHALSRRASALKAAWPIALGVVVTAGIVAAAGRPAPSAPAFGPPSVRPAAPLTATASGECTSCHTREVAEWQRSVMAHATKSPLFGALESLVEEQVGRDERCPNGAGVLRRTGADACRDERTGVAVTGAGGEHWCVNCHAPGDNLKAESAVLPWSAFGSPRSRAPLRDLLPAASMEGIACAGCHTAIGPVPAHGNFRVARYEGNPTWTSFLTGATFRARPEDLEGRVGIANSGYALDLAAFLGASDALVHKRPSAAARTYVRSSEFCGACHDVRLFGTDILGVRERGEHFKRLRNGYSEWREWSDLQRRLGKPAATCQDCHMSQYPGVCASGDGPSGDCPSGTHFEARAPGSNARLRAASSSDVATKAAQHYFTSVEIPLSPAFPDLYADEPGLDAAGLPLGLRARRDLLLKHTYRFALAPPARLGAHLEIPVVIENVGAGHRVPGGFSQEREAWVELTVKDARGAVVYQVGRVSREDEDLKDKIFVRVTTSDSQVDAKGRPLGLFGADVVDGPDVAQWSPNPARGGTTFRGRGLINLQNGFLRCVRCIGFIDAQGKCQAAPGQGRTRADRFDDGGYDLDTGECRSNLSNGNELFETYFPVGALDADRGVAKAPDAIIDTRAAAPNVVLSYTYAIDAGLHPAPFEVEARLRFRAFPPYLIRAFATYEARKAAQGLRPSGPQVTEGMLRRVEITDVASARVRIP